MKLYKAFTLAEVLIALAIVGIIAALVIPSLATKISTESNMAQLSKSVTLIQNGMGEIFQQAQSHSDEADAIGKLSSIQVKDLFETAPAGASNNDYIADDQNLFTLTGGIIGIQTMNNYLINNIKNYDGSNVDANLFSNCETYKFNKNNSVLIVPNINTGDVNEDKVIAKIFIDINGASAPNRIGTDVFLFGLSNNGILIPAGSEKYNDNVFNENINSYQTDCQNDITTGLSCTARVMADGWKIKY